MNLESPAVKVAIEMAQRHERMAMRCKWPVLTAIRVLFGFLFAVNGWGKVNNIEGIAAWFGGSLGLPFPLVNAYLASYTELLGGIALLLGAGGRAAALPLVFTMIVAYCTSDKGFIDPLFSDASGFDRLFDTADKFASATPFNYLVAALLTAVFGSGPLSMDGILARQLGLSAPPEEPPV